MKTGKTLLVSILVFAVSLSPNVALASAKSCVPSPVRELGPFYKPNTPYKNDICEEDPRMHTYGYSAATGTFSRTHFKGTYPLIVRGVVRDGNSCEGVGNAEVEAYQAHQFGKYGDLNPNSNEEGFCRGVVRTNAKGEFEFKTYMPGSYGVLAGLSPLGPGWDLPPFVDRHIHLLVWAQGHEVLPTQLLMLDDPLLGSGIRGLAHGYDGSGLALEPKFDEELGAWVSEGVELVLPATKERVEATRAEAVRKYCLYSAGDMIVPAVCMPTLARFIKPSHIYMGLPFMLYVGGPSLIVCLLNYVLRRAVTQRWVKNSLRASVVPTFVALVSLIVSPARESSCLSTIEKHYGANLVKTTDGRYLEYFRLGSTDIDSRKIILQHGSAREGGAFRHFDNFFKQHKLDVIAPTLPGFGCSSKCKGRAVKDWPPDVEVILQDAGWMNSSFLVAGYSFGGPHALSLCATMPKRVDAALIVSPTMPPEFESEIKHEEPKLGRGVRFLQRHGEDAFVQTLVEMLAMVVGTRKLLPPIVHQAMKGMESDGLGSLVQSLHNSWERAISRSTGGVAENLVVRQREWGFKLDEVAVNGPVVIVANPDDTIDPLSIAEFLAKRIENARLKQWTSKHGHWHYWAEWEKQMTYFLEQLN